MNSQTKLFQSGSFNFKLKHLVIIGVLVLAFSTSFLIRSQATNHGFELNEFDPFFNFRATEYIVENGIAEYFEWNDDKSWYPIGRDVSATSQVMLHMTAAITYEIFGGDSSVYDFTILFPAVIGSLTVIIIFGLVRLFAGNTAGLIASLLFAISLPIILRGSIGWFKSEPLGIFYGLLGLYLFLSGIKSKNKTIVISKIIFGGIIMGFGMASWGGNQFFIIPLGLFILSLPFLRKDHNFLLWSIPLFVITFLLTSASFERPGPSFVYGMGGLSLIIPTIFLITCIFIQKISSDKNKIRNGLILLFFIIVMGSSSLVIAPLFITENSAVQLPSFRYLNAINPFLTTMDPLVDSVAEHATTSIKESFFFHSIMMIFAGLGVWLIISKKISQTEIFVQNDMKIFVLIIGITGVYVSSAFIRLEVFASISLIIFASIGLSILTKQIFKIKYSGKKNYFLKITYVTIIFIFFMIPLTYPDSNWITVHDKAPIIFTGGTSYPPSNDWVETLEWIKLNTPENAVIASWWDYGYWIQTMSDRASLADNSTVHTNIIENIAKMFLSTPDDSWDMLTEMDADYLIIFVASQKFLIETTTGEDQMYYVLGGGGEESKKSWFIRIANLPLEKFVYSDYVTGTDYFNNETLLGQAIPFTTQFYFNDQTQEMSNVYKPGFFAVKLKDIKYGPNDDGPLKLVYTSSSVDKFNESPMLGVFVYEINKNYKSLSNDSTMILK